MSFYLFKILHLCVPDYHSIVQCILYLLILLLRARTYQILCESSRLDCSIFAMPLWIASKPLFITMIDMKKPQISSLPVAAGIYLGMAIAAKVSIPMYESTRMCFELAAIAKESVVLAVFITTRRLMMLHLRNDVTNFG